MGHRFVCDQNLPITIGPAVLLSEITRFKVRQFVRKHEKLNLPEPRNKGEPRA